MTKLPIKERFWKRKLERERLSLSVSRTLARRVFYAGSFFYLSFLAHGFFIYDKSAAAADPARSVAVASVATDQAPLERGVTEPLLDRVLGVRRPR